MKLLKKERCYKITIENMTNPNIPVDRQELLQFEITDREDIFEIVNKLRNRSCFDFETSASLGVGLRLFGGVMLRNKWETLFTNLMPHFKEFMKELKRNVR